MPHCGDNTCSWQAFSRDSAAPPLVVAFCWAASRLATEGLVIFLIHSGIGLASIRRSAGVASLWAVFSFVACYIVQTERFHERSHVVALVYLIPPWVFYLASIVIPLAWFPRCVLRTIHMNDFQSILVLLQDLTTLGSVS